jgi:biopolymer transport protein ExbB/TolQ
MLEFRIITIASLVTIFVSVFFIHFAFNSFIRVSEVCAMESGVTCSSPSMFLIFLFCFSVVLAFIVVIETTVYYIFREVEVNMMAQISGRKSSEKTMQSLEKRKEELLKAKKDANRKYFGREIDENTYRELKQKYDKEIMELEMEINKMKLKSME